MKFGRYTKEEAQNKKRDLPKWTQDYINHLEYEVERLQRQIQEFDESQSISNISWQYQMDQEHWIPEHSCIKFYHDSDRWSHRSSVDIFFRNDGDRKILEIHGSNCYSIEPRSGNSVYIVMESNKDKFERYKTETQEKMSEL